MNVHIVQKGDTLWKIAKQHQIPFDELKRLNAHLANPDYIVPGMEIYLPDTANRTNKKKEAPIQPQVMPMPSPPMPPKKEMPVKETPTTKPTVPISPPQTAPIQPQQQPQPQPQPQPPSWMPFPQPMPMPMPIPMPYPQQTQPIIMPQQPAMPMPVPMPYPMPPAQQMPMQCPSCRMTVMIAMPQMPQKEEVKQAPIETEPPKKENIEPCGPPKVPWTGEMPCMQPAIMPWMQHTTMPWGGGHCRSCQQPVPYHPSWHWPTPQPLNWSQPMHMAMNESSAGKMPQVAGIEQWQHPDLKCEMQQHIVNQYYDEIREIEQNNRPCHPQFIPQQHLPYVQ